MGSAAALLDPHLDLGEIPDHAPRRKIKAARKFAALLHLVNRCVPKRHNFPQFGTPDGSARL
jgi:hypothetical protein